MRFEENLCASTTVRYLNEVADLCQEDINKPIWVWDCIKENFLSLE